MSSKQIPTHISDALHGELSIAMQSAFGEAMHAIGATPQPCCFDCAHSAKPGLGCHLAGGAVPPLQVICKGCPAFKRDPIEF
jgi:hypothetical protein